MKRILFFLLMLVCSSIASIAQLRLNEIYQISDTTSVASNRQFFEVALAPTQTASVNSDSYMLLAYFNTGSDSGFYVLDLPAKTITSDVDAVVTPGDFLVGSSGGSTAYQDVYTGTTDYNWKLPPANASTKKYSYNGTAFVEQAGANVDEIFNFTAAYPQRLAVFLYRKPSGSSTMQLTDAFVASVAENRASIPAEIFTFNNLTVPLKQTGLAATNVTFVFNTTLSKYSPWGVVLAGPENDGYYYCSTWEKVIPHPSDPQNPSSPLIVPRMTPRAPNTPAQGEPLMATTDCMVDSSFISVIVTAGQVSPYPIHATLYADLNHNQKLDLNVFSPDEYRSDITIRNKGEEYFMDKAPEDVDLILVLDAAADCFDAILPFTCTAPVVTPVTLSTFDAQRIGSNSNVKLTWETASETNNKGFYIQRRSGSNDKWHAVTFVDSKAPDGNSNAAMHYTFTDVNTSNSVTQYRLMQVDRDGKAKFSEIRIVRGLEQSNRIVVFPNPSNGIVNVLFEDATSLRNVMVTDMVGRILKQWKGVSTGSMQISDLLPGLYNIRIHNTKTGQQKIERVMVIR